MSEVSSPLSALLADPRRVAQIPEEEVAQLLLQVAALLTALSTRPGTRPANRQGDADGDTLLDVTEAARRLSVSRDWLYRHGKRLPFAIQVRHKHLRFSVRGIDRWLKARQGR